MQNPLDRRMKRLWFVIITFTLTSFLLTLSSVAASGNPTYQDMTVTPDGNNGNDKDKDNDGSEKITICHVTGSATSPYELITISVNGLNGHDGHGDLIPAPVTGCPSILVTLTPTAMLNGNEKITICHATGNATNPYRLITISVNGLNGHDGHDDIIPAPATGCPTTVMTVTPMAMLNGNEKITICHATGSATNPYELITISVNGLNGHDGHGDIIPAPAAGCPTTVITATPTAIPCGDVDNDGGFPVIGTDSCPPDTSVVARPSWDVVSIGSAVCTEWLVYHTDVTGDWELFRLDSAPSNFEPNLSRGIGAGVSDISPSRSPDAQWIVFTSNRDGNWEIYLSAVETDHIQRVTYNTTAIDRDPTWSPMGNSIVYESNRDGNWNLYLFDVASGVETLLTKSPNNDVNASWSSDGTKLLFQSDRTDAWQIFELTIATGDIRKISDETSNDIDPQYTPDNLSIVFRSFRSGDNSVIYRMNADGLDIQPLSDPAGYAKDHGISPQGDYIAYTSNIDGDNDIYVYEMASKLTRQVTDSIEDDYAPTWYCGDTNLAFTSQVTANADLFSASALPINAPPIAVMTGANQLTTSEANEQYPMLSPAEENASRTQILPSPVTNP